MTPDQKFSFFRETVSLITGSLDLEKSMVSVFDFLKEHFPIEGVSLQQFSSDLSILKLLFLVTRDRFSYVEETLALPRENVISMENFEQCKDQVVLSDLVTHSTSDAHRKAISHLLPYKPCSYLVGHMQAGQTSVGHLCFIGSHRGCFTRDHMEKMKLVLPPFTLAMSNMLKFRRTLAFQQELNEEKNHLEKELRLIQDSPLIGTSGGLHGVMEMVRQLEGRDTPVLILGETGTGKELIAGMIQKVSPRDNQPFVKVNCGAIPENLIDSELFGYEKGVFTGADQSHPGRFEQADGGTLFLDEVGELPLPAQVRFLRTLQNGTVERLGGKTSIPVDTRIIAATNKDLGAMLQKGSFREDLYYRLYVFPIQLPPLRQRLEDLPSLVHGFIKKACIQLNISPLPVLHTDSMARLRQYSWPGNVRELENLIKRSIILATDGIISPEVFLPKDDGWYLTEEQSRGYMESLIDQRIQAALANLSPRASGPAELPAKQPEARPQRIKSLDQTVKEIILAALTQCRGQVHGPGGAASLLSVHPSTLRHKMRKLNINPGDLR
ncbi:MAG: sigma-54-dependent Fis family transcriptional regulator [Desulfobacter sp.]|nr:MAG: sigma-54-dependent Fis family transcriptional regulator [Desulfobacter sp.]